MARADSAIRAKKREEHAAIDDEWWRGEWDFQAFRGLPPSSGTTTGMSLTSRGPEECRRRQILRAPTLGGYDRIRYGISILLVVHIFYVPFTTIPEDDGPFCLIISIMDVMNGQT